jgi:hypothetical protein
MTSAALTTALEQYGREMRAVAAEAPATGACAIGTALDLWLWTFQHVQQSTGGSQPAGGDQATEIDRRRRERDLASLCDALAGLLSARALVASGCSQAEESADASIVTPLFADLCHAASARAAGDVGRICADIVFGRLEHPTWDPACEACIAAGDADALEGIMPGMSYGARLTEDVLEEDGSHPEKAGPCVRLDALQGFISRRNKLDGCLSGARTAADRAARALQELADSPCP